MIQFKRGTTKKWRDFSSEKTSSPVILADGQPGYDKSKHKIKIGDGSKVWTKLPYASGLRADEILNSETIAAKRFKDDSEDTTVITYGTADPDEKTVGQLYLQHYDSEPETDYIVSNGINGIWTYQKWHSGIARCWGTVSLETSIKKLIGGAEETGLELYHNDTTMKSTAYPFTFKSVPCETATLQGANKLAWLANKNNNTASASASYTIISIGSSDAVKHSISLQVEGFWK